MITITGDFGATTDLTPLSIEEEWRGPRIRRFRRKLEREARLRGDGAIVWEDSGSIIPPEVLREDGRVEVPENHEEAYKRHEESDTSSHASQEPTAEQKFEMRAAFGEGQTVVDVRTGQTYQT